MKNIARKMDWFSPNQAKKLSVIDRKYVHLENMNGKMCKYEIATGKIIP